MSISTSDLDFDKIKAKLKTYFKQSDEFADYDFEASGLSNILDVLAYNTHVNGLTANMAINESFLSTAQLRSSILQHAEALGYYPKSATASTAYLNVSVNAPSGPSRVVMPEYTQFRVDVDQITYIFRTTTNVSAPKVDGTYTFDVEVKQGEPKARTFVVGADDDSQVFVIPDENVDTSTVVVKVFDNFTTANYTPYVDVNKALTIDQNSTVYMMREVANGHYEVFFGDGNVLGKAPVAGNKIRVEYLSTQGSVANTASQFIGSLLRVGADEYPIIVNSATESAGGSSKESIESIRKNAPALHATQKRLVTALDYQTLIQSTFSNYIDGVVAWGGEDNDPPKFGCVFASLNFKPGLDSAVQDEVKRLIVDQLTSNISIMSIDTEFVGPVTSFLELSVRFNVDPSKTSTTSQGLELRVSQIVQQYFADNLEKFNAVFRRSNILTRIDDLSTAILNSRIDVKIQQRISDISFGSERNYELQYPVSLASPDKDHHIITTTSFMSNGQSVVIKNELGSSRLQMFNTSNEVILANVGQYDATLGTVNIEAVNIQQPTILKVSAMPANASTIRPPRNHIIELDGSVLNVTGVREEV